jgi:signal transduction histidine kinase
MSPATVPAMPPSAAASPAVPPALPRWRWWAQQALIIVMITAVVSAGLMIVFNQRLVPTLVYCFCITLCCSFFVQTIRIGLARLVHLRSSPEDRAKAGDWPGWPLMLVSLVLGTALGYSAGTELANGFTGFNEAGIHNTSLRRAISIMLISLIPGLALTFYFLNRSRLAAAEALAQNAQRQAAEHQLRLLETQLEPHMLFNTLANLRVLIGLDAQRAQAMLDQLIAFLRATLNASRRHSHPLQDEFGRLADYLALMQVRMGGRLRTALILPPELATLPVPPLLLQPLVENAIKHGLEPHVDGGELIVSAAREQGRLMLTVRDTGAGLSAAAAQSGTGFGLEQVRARLATQYGPAASLTLAPADDERGGTLACLRLPLDTPSSKA